MTVFTQSLSHDLQRLPGASHAFVRQVYSPEGAAVRDIIERAVAEAPPWLAERAADQLRSLDNRRFFQGFAELAAAATLRAGGWRLDGLRSPGGLFAARRPDGRAVNVLPLAFLHSSRQPSDPDAVRRLQAALCRVSTKLSFIVIVRKWLPPNFSPEPVRHVVEMWLKEVESGGWDGRFAAYEDAEVMLEFGLTGEKVRPGRPPVRLTLGPFLGAHTIAVVERRLIQELDRARLGPYGDEPLLLMPIADQPFNVGRGYMRELLYGKPRWIRTSGEPGEIPWQAGLSGAAEPSLFKDPLYRNVLGVAFLERPLGAITSFTGRACSNPFSAGPLLPDELPLRTVAQHRIEEDCVVIRWFETKTRLTTLAGS